MEKKRKLQWIKPKFEELPVRYTGAEISGTTQDGFGKTTIAS